LDAGVVPGRQQRFQLSNAHLLDLHFGFQFPLVMVVAIWSLPLVNPMCQYFKKSTVPTALADYLELD
jgi:hypothetical protein